MRFILATMMFLSLIACVNAADIMMVRDDTITINGYLLPGDEIRVAELVDQYPVEKIMFHSFGGGVLVGMAIGELAKSHNLTTTAVTYCNSACTYAWLGGAVREVHMFEFERILDIKIHMPAAANDPAAPIPDWLVRQIETYLVETAELEPQTVAAILATPYSNILDVGPKSYGEYHIDYRYAPTSARY